MLRKQCIVEFDMFLIKYSKVEGDGKRWWFLYECQDKKENFMLMQSFFQNETFRRHLGISLVKRFSSEEELEVEAMVKYGNLLEVVEIS